MEGRSGAPDAAPERTKDLTRNKKDRERRRVGGARHAQALALADKQAEIDHLCGSFTDPEPKIWAASPDENTPWGPNKAVRSIPRGHGTEGLPPSWSLHRVMTSLWSPRVQVTPSRVLHGSEPWAPAGWRRGPHGRPRAVPSPNWNPRGA
jgi:hypothetical protein